MKTPTLGLLVAALTLVGCGRTGPTAPTSLHGPHKAIYLIYLTDENEVAWRRAQFPSGVTNLSPEEAAETFDAPLSAALNVRELTPPGVLIPPDSYRFDLGKSAGRIDLTGLEYEWVGYFYPALR